MSGLTDSGKDSDKNHNPFARGFLSATWDTTEAQREIWLACSLGKEASLAFNESLRIEIRGSIDTAALHGAFQDLLVRHEALRSVFSGDGMKVCLFEETVIPLLVHDHRNSAQNYASTCEAEAQNAVREPFDLFEAPPLLRAVLIQGPEGNNTLFMTGHHIVCDGWSSAIMVRDIGAFYTARIKNTAVKLNPAARMLDYANFENAYHKSPAFAGDCEYWKKIFIDIPPVVELPNDRPRPPSRTFHSERYDVEFPSELFASLRKVSAQTRAGFVVVMLAAYKAYLSRVIGLEDVAIAMPAAGQAQEGYFDLVGHCVNTIVIRTQPKGQMSFTDFAKTVRAQVTDGFLHQRLSLSQLLRLVQVPRDPSRMPLSPILFNVDKKLSSKDLGFDGLEVTYAGNPRAYENFEIFYNLAEADGKLVLEAQYNTDLFTRAWMDNHIRGWIAFLENLVKNPASLLSDISLVDAQQQKLLLGDWNKTKGEAPKQAFIETILDQATTHGAKVAIIGDKKQLTYLELAKEVEGLALNLQSRGVGPGSLVGLGLSRGPDLLVAALGILAAGAAYVPLDPAYPQDRLDYMVEHGALKWIITSEDNKKVFAHHSSEILLWEEGLCSTKGQRKKAEMENPAYVIFTSGSTGKPKGVVVNHRNISQFLIAMKDKPGMNAEDTLLAITTLSFDIATLELYLPLLVGGTVVIATQEQSLDGQSLMDLINKHGVSMLQATPASWRMLITAGWNGGKNFRALCGGEALPADLAEQLLSRCSELWNMYGPTETTVWSTCQRVVKANEITIGLPIINTQVYVLNPDGQLVPPGSIGELWIGGEGVSDGYLNRPDLTSERFMELKRVPSAGRCYRTGDLVRFLSDGRLAYLQRNDFQVKVRGFRIELGEIERVLMEDTAVSSGIVIVREDRPGDQRLVAYFTSPSQTPSEKDLKQNLRKSLPEYMIPQHMIQLEALPLLPNGKINRHLLPAPTFEVAAVDESMNETEKEVAALWAEKLGVPNVPAEHDFFMLGGHSLLATQILAELRRRHSVALELREFLKAPTVRALAKSLTGSGKKAELSIPRLPGVKQGRLSIIQERVYYLDQLDPGSGANNLPDGRHLRGRFNQKAWLQAFDEIVAKHEQMRMHVVETENGPEQVIVDSWPNLVEHHDFSGLDEKTKEIALDTLFRKSANTPFNLLQGPLARFNLIKMSDDYHIFTNVFHHIIWDGWCFDIFWNEMNQRYKHLVEGSPITLPPLHARYLEFAPWHRNWSREDDRQKQLDFWKTYLAAPIKLAEIPTDNPRPAAKGKKGRRHSFVWPKELTEQIDRLAKAESTTPYAVMVALLKAYTYRSSQGTDIVIGTPTQGRIHPDIEQTVGYFINTLPIRTKLSGDESFRSLVKKVTLNIRGAFGHQDLPFEDMIQQLPIPRDPSRTTAYSTMFAYQDVNNRNYTWPGLDAKYVHLPHEYVGSDLSIWVRKNADGMVGGIDYRIDLFTIPRIQKLYEDLTELCEQVVKRPDAALDSYTFTQPALKGRVDESDLGNKLFSAVPSLKNGLVITADQSEPSLQWLKKIGMNTEFISGKGLHKDWQTAIDNGANAAVLSQAQLQRWVETKIELPSNFVIFVTNFSPALSLKESLPEDCKLIRLFGEPVYGFSFIESGRDARIVQHWSLDGSVRDAKGQLTTVQSRGRFHTATAVIPGEAWIDVDGQLFIDEAASPYVNNDGFSLCLSDVENRLKTLPHVLDAYVWIDAEGEIQGSIAIERADLQPVVQQALKLEIPEYMRPKKLLWSEALPYDLGSKIREERLKQHISEIVPTRYEAPVTTSEKALAEIWQTVLQIENVSRHDNFFDLGGYSLLPLIVINKIEELTKTRVPLHVFTSSTLMQIAPLCGFEESELAHES